MALYRREFEFMSPQIPADDAEDRSESDEGEDGRDDEFQGRNEIINGIEIQTHSLMSPGGMLNGPGKMKRSKSIAIKAEGTQMNFFDAGGDRGLYELDKPEEDLIIEAKIDPLEWNKELDRVY